MSADASTAISLTAPTFACPQPICARMARSVIIMPIAISRITTSTPVNAMLVGLVMALCVDVIVIWMVGLIST